MGGRSTFTTSKISRAEGEEVFSVGLIPLGEWGNTKHPLRVVRLISRKSLNVQAAADAVRAAVKFVDDFKGQLLVTAGGFGVPQQSYPYGAREATAAVQGFIDDFLRLVPPNRSFDMILGVDDSLGWLQDSYFIPGRASSLSECVRAFKSYPRSDEERYLLTKGVSCPTRVVHTAGWAVTMLICHDVVAFAGRSQSNRGELRSKWAEQLSSEVARGDGTYIVHLIHYIDSSNQGRIFANGMESLVGSGVTASISAFKTKLDKNSQAIKQIQERTTRFAGPTLDLYLQ